MLFVLMGTTMTLFSCKNDEKLNVDDNTPSGDKASQIAGLWNISGIDYLFDGVKLDYHENKIGYWRTSEGGVSFYVVQGNFLFGDDGTGVVSGMGENGSDSFAVNYKEADGVYTITSEFNKNVQLTMQFDDGRLSYHFLIPNVYGWSNVNDRNSKQGFDGKGDHTIDVITYLTKSK